MSTHLATIKGLTGNFKANLAPQDLRVIRFAGGTDRGCCL